MTLLNFPSTAGKPTDGSFTYTANGVIYSWDGEKWTANSESGLNTTYVQVAGDTMTGDLDIGNIHLDTDGSASFAGPATAISSTGAIGARNYYNEVNDATFACYAGRNYSGTTTSEIFADGSAKFANTISSGSSDYTGPYAYMSKDGIGLMSDSSTPNIALVADGKATFGSAVTINDPTNSSGHFFGAGGGAEHTVASGAVGTTPVLSVIKGFGNSTFQVTADGTITTGTYDNTANGVGGIELGALGACSVQRVNGTSDTATIYIGYRGNDKQFEVQATGQIYSRASTSVNLIGSERRLKKDIELIDPVVSWETIRDLPYYQYKLIGSEQTSYGPIVDECPQEMVMEGITEDEQGNIRTYDNSMLQSRLFVALQTALTRIEALEETNASLEERLTALEGGTN